MNKTTKQLLEENDLREKQLSLENQKLLTDIVAYLRSSSASTCVPISRSVPFMKASEP